MHVEKAKEPKVSIIVPVYNDERYLKRCLDSICEQTLTDIEIIIINDGSTDNSHSIIERCAANDARMKYVMQGNSGPSAARNAGLATASGEYIGFVDSDDWVERDMYEELYRIVKEHDADLGVCGRQDVIGKTKIVTSGQLEDECFSIKAMGVEHFFLHKRDALGVIQCNKIYKHALIREYNLKCELNKNIFSEDILFNLYYQLHCDKVACTTKVLYNYRIRPGSLTTSAKPGIEPRMMNTAVYFHNRLQQENMLHECVTFDAYFMLTMAGAAYKNAFLSNSDKYWAMLRAFKTIAGEPLYRKKLKHSMKSKIPTAWRIKAGVFLIKPFWLASIITYSIFYLKEKGMLLLRKKAPQNALILPLLIFCDGAI